MNFKIKWAETALRDYKKCLKEKWDHWQITENDLNCGLCYYFTYHFTPDDEFMFEEGDSMYDLMNEVIDEAGVDEKDVFGEYYGCNDVSHEERFAKRIKFLEAFVQELQKEAA